jgi:hypothetical protein
MAKEGEVQLLDLCASLALSSVNFSVSSALPALGRWTFLRLRRRVRQVARPSSGFVDVFIRSLDPSSAPSSLALGRQTSLRLRCRLRQVA